MSTHTDILIIGAGLSGIGTASHLSARFPGKSIAILERRERVGGTWDLFRYPGIRSDADMFSFGYEFRPWTDTKVLADGDSIRDYIEGSARDHGVMDAIEFNTRTTSVSWSSNDARWTVDAVDEKTGEESVRTASFLINCAGYYDHDEAHDPSFPGSERFRGEIVHPQFWPEGLDYAGKKVVVIGSGATAVTVVPAMAGVAEHVTMLQRSPSYVIALPANDAISGVLNRFLSERTVYRFGRWRNIAINRALYLACRRWPKAMRKLLLAQVRRRIGPDVDMAHFTPRYDPWDERLCAVPDGDLFDVLRDGSASVVTDTIETFTETGIRLSSGAELEADIIVTATGLKLQMLGGVDMQVDGEPKAFSDQLTYKATLIEGIPNFGWIFGYTNAPWTLKSDIAAGYLCELLAHMDANGHDSVVPRDRDGSALDDGMLDMLQSGYVQRGKDLMPRQGTGGPWQVRMHYGKDKAMLAAPVDDGNLQFGSVAASGSKPRISAVA